jgi:hypothetical protein
MSLVEEDMNESNVTARGNVSDIRIDAKRKSSPLILSGKKMQFSEILNQDKKDGNISSASMRSSDVDSDSDDDDEEEERKDKVMEAPPEDEDDEITNQKDEIYQKRALSQIIKKKQSMATPKVGPLSYMFSLRIAQQIIVPVAAAMYHEEITVEKRMVLDLSAIKTLFDKKNLGHLIFVISPDQVRQEIFRVRNQSFQPRGRSATSQSSTSQRALFSPSPSPRGAGPV